MTAQLVYLTASSRAEAETIATTVVGERLAACANLIDPILSIFQWQGSACRETECAVLLKTTADRSEALVERVVQLHSYDCPCVLILPVCGGHPEFLQWIDGQCRVASD